VALAAAPPAYATLAGYDGEGVGKAMHQGTGVCPAGGVQVGVD